MTDLISVLFQRCTQLNRRTSKIIKTVSINIAQPHQTHTRNRDRAWCTQRLESRQRRNVLQVEQSIERATKYDIATGCATIAHDRATDEEIVKGVSCVLIAVDITGTANLILIVPTIKLENCQSKTSYVAADGRPAINTRHHIYAIATAVVFENRIVINTIASQVTNSTNAVRTRGEG